MSEDKISRRGFIQRTGGAAAAVLAAGAFGESAQAADGVSTLDVRENALIGQQAPQKGDDFVPYFNEVKMLPEGDKAIVKLLAAQAYQISYIAEGEEGKKKLTGFALPQQDGTMQVYKLREGQEVQLRFMVAPNSDKEVARTGNIAPNLKEGEGVPYMKGIMDQIDKADTKTYEAAYNNLAVDYQKDLVAQFDAAKNKSGSPIADLKDTTIHPDPHAVGRANGTIPRTEKSMEK